MNKKTKMKTAIISLIAVLVTFTILAILYYRQLHRFPVVAYYEEGQLIYDERGYVYVGTVSTLELDQVDRITLGEIKPYNFASTWISNNPLQTIEGYEDLFLLVPQFHSPYLLYSTDPNYTVEEFLELIEYLS